MKSDSIIFGTIVGAAIMGAAFIAAQPRPAAAVAAQPAAAVAPQPASPLNDEVQAADGRARLAEARLRKVFYELVKQKAAMRSLIAEVGKATDSVSVHNILSKYDGKKNQFTVRVGSADATEE